MSRGRATTPQQTLDLHPTEIQSRSGKAGTRLEGFNCRTVTLSRKQNNYPEYDINGYRKDRRTEVKSNNYFSRDREEDSLGEKKTSQAGKKPEWRNVYGKGTSQPADGAVNAFQWSE